MTRPARLLPFAAFSATLVAGGCAGPLNGRVGLTGAQLPALADYAPASELQGQATLAAGLDRSAWPVVSVPVPLCQVWHHPHFTCFFRWQRNRGPWNPEFPSVSAALVDETSACADLADAATELVFAPAVVITVPIAAAVVGPGIVSRSPDEPYQRVPPG